MTNEIKTEDIIRGLRCCKNNTGIGCTECPFDKFDDDHCLDELLDVAADRLEQLTKRLDELTTENELLRGALATMGA